MAYFDTSLLDAGLNRAMSRYTSKKRREDAQEEEPTSQSPATTSALTSKADFRISGEESKKVENEGVLSRASRAWEAGEGMHKMNIGYQEKWRSGNANAGEANIEEGRKLLQDNMSALGDQREYKGWIDMLTDSDYYYGLIATLPSNWEIMKTQLVAGTVGKALAKAGAGASATIVGIPVGGAAIAAGISTQAGGVAIATKKEASMEAGDAYSQKYNELLERGTDQATAHREASAAAAKSYKANMALLGVTNAVEQISTFGIFSDVASKAGKIGRKMEQVNRALDQMGKMGTVARVGGKIGTVAATEAFQEGTQYGVQQWALDKPFDAGSSEFRENVAAGAILGGGMATAGVTLSAGVDKVSAKRMDKDGFDGGPGGPEIPRGTLEKHPLLDDIDPILTEGYYEGVVSNLSDELKTVMRSSIESSLESGLAENEAISLAFDDLMQYDDGRAAITQAFNRSLGDYMGNLQDRAIKYAFWADAIGKLPAQQQTSLQNLVAARTMQLQDEFAAYDEVMTAFFQGTPEGQALVTDAIQRAQGTTQGGGQPSLQASAPATVMPAAMPTETGAQQQQEPVEVGTAVTMQKTGEPLTVVDTSNPEFLVVKNSQGSIDMVPHDAVSVPGQKADSSAQAMTDVSFPESPAASGKAFPQGPFPTGPAELRGVSPSLPGVPARTGTEVPAGPFIAPQTKQETTGEEVSLPVTGTMPEGQTGGLEGKTEAGNESGQGPKARELWMATKAEVLAPIRSLSHDDVRATTSAALSDGDIKQFLANKERKLLSQHKAEVKKALAEGKPVPAKVLKDYPGLTKQSKGESPAIVKGSAATAKTERGTTVDVQYAVADVNSLIASHTTDFAENKGYPQELQPRNRERAASRAQVYRMANNIEPEFLGESPKASDGAPIVGTDMVVESGNGRIIALKIAYQNQEKNESAGRYKAWLLENAARFGIDPQKIAQVKNPVLVRVRSSDVDRVQFTKEANEQSVSAMSTSEQAVSDAEKLSGELLQMFFPGENGDILVISNRSFIQGFLSEVIGPTEQARYVTSDGSISQEGVNRIKNAIFAKAYKNIQAIEKLAESTDNNIKNITNALLMAAPKFTQLKAGIEAGNLYDIDITPDIAEATIRMSLLRESGRTLGEYIEEQENGLFGSDLPVLIKDILVVFNKNKRSSKKITQILTGYVDGIVSLGDPRQMSMFGEIKQPAKGEILQTAINVVERSGEDGLQTSLFGNEAMGSAADGARSGKVGQRGIGTKAAKGGRTEAAEEGPAAGSGVRLKKAHKNWGISWPEMANSNNPDLTIRGAEKIINDGITDYAEWKRSMVEEFGPDVSPRLSELWYKANRLIIARDNKEEEARRRKASFREQEPSGLTYEPASAKERREWDDRWTWKPKGSVPGTSGSNLQPRPKGRAKAARISEDQGNLARREQIEKAPVFYSQLQRVIEQKMPNQAHPGQILAIIKKGQVKEEEIKWSGVEDWLTAQKQKLSKQEVLDYLRANDVQVEEVTKEAEWLLERQDPDTGDWDYVGSYPSEQAARNARDSLSEKYPDSEWSIERPVRGGVQYSTYQLPGGENYRELLFTMPGERAYKSAHWDESNVLAHVRFNDRTGANGEKVLHIEEVQSDWHQAGRQKGYRTDTASLERRMQKLEKEIAELNKQNKEWGFDPYALLTDAVPEPYKSNFKKMETLNEEYNNLEQQLKTAKQGFSLVPDAPFKTTWHEFAMKRMIRYAAENGYDRITWTTGEQQAARYNLSKQISKITAHRIEPDKYSKEIRYNVTADDLGGRNVINRHAVTKDELADFVGKEVAEKIISANKPVVELSGLDLQVGGEGMKGFYDRMIPSWLNKYAKKWGARVEESVIEYPGNGRSYDYEKTTNGTGKYEIFDTNTRQPVDWVSTEQEAINYINKLSKGETYPVHSLPITDAMRESVLYEGQPKFKRTLTPEQKQDLKVLKEVAEERKIGPFRIGKVELAPEAMERPEFRAAGEIAEKLGLRLVTYRGKGAARGAQYGRTIYLNESVTDPLDYVFWHEVAHSMATTHRKYYERLLDLCFDHLADAEGVNKHYWQQGYARQERPHEFIVDVFAEAVARPGFFARMAEQAPELIKPLLEAIDRLIANVKGKISEDDTIVPFLRDWEALREKIREEVATPYFRDAMGKKQFVETFGKQWQEPAAKAKVETAKADPTNTPEFRQWFGDSKVVDEQGKPLVVYKGMYPYNWETGKEITSINRNSGFPSFAGEPDTKIAGFFGDIDTANMFAEKSGTKNAVYPAYLSFQKPYIIDAKGGWAGDFQFGNSGKPFRDAIRSGEYDGIIIKNTKDEGTVYVALKPEQIKSVYNRGTFDPTNPDMRFKKPAKAKFELKDQDIQQRMDAACGIPKETMQEKLAVLWGEFKRKSTREFEWLPRTAEFAELRQALLNLQKQKSVAATLTQAHMDNITKEMGEYEYSLFSAKVILDDLSEEVDMDHLLPFGFTKETLEKELGRVNEFVEQNDRVSNAIKQRHEIWTEIKEEYTRACKSIGFKVENRLKRESYYRHQVLDYARTKGFIRGSGGKLRTPTSRGFLKEREGSERDINTDYLQAEFEVMAQMLLDAEIAKTIKVVNQEHNIVQHLEREAARINNQRMMEYFADQVRIHKMKKTSGQLYQDLLNSKQAKFIDRLEEMAVKGELPAGANNEFKEFLLDMAANYVAKKSGERNMYAMPDLFLREDEYAKQFYEYMNWLTERSDNEQVKAVAEGVFKGMAAKQRMIQNTLGKKYVTWQDLIPEGYSAWQPREGNMFYTANSLAENVAEELFYNIVSEVGVTADMLRKVLAVGQKFPQMVVPNEVALTLDNLQKVSQEGEFAKVYHTAYRAWKQWQLVSPRRFFKYNVRNFTGDFDALFAGNPSALLKAPDAFKDLWQAFFTKEKVMSPELKEWFKRGGFETLFQAQEINDINHNRQFRHLMESKMKKTPLESLKNAPKNTWLGYWDAARTSTDFREALLRYACYLDYLEQIQGNSGKPKNFGASRRDEIMAIKDYRNRAFKLANELMGAYDEVSVMGQWLANNFIPFWRWNEVNFVRYIGLWKNAWQDGKMLATVGRRAATLPVRSAFMAMKIGKFVIKAGLLTAIITAWNHLIFPDEEDDLPKDVKERLHIVLGRNDQGEVIYFSRLGALQDFLDWFGADTPVLYVQEFLSGRKNVKEIATDMAKDPLNKLLGSFGPQVTLPAGLAAETEFFPDVTNPRHVYDKTEFLFKSFGLEHEYKLIFGKPSRPYTESLGNIFLYKSDPLQVGYYSLREEKARYMKQIGKGREGWMQSPRTEALASLKMAIRYGDKRAAEKYLIKYMYLGGTEEGLQRSLESLHPLSGLNKEEQVAFAAQLDSDGLANLYQAMVYYQTVLNPQY